MRRRLALAAVAPLLALGCATPGRHHVDERPAGYARAEPDPACRGTVLAWLSERGLEQVTVKVAVTRDGRLAFLDVLTPDLSPAAALEVRRAFESCVWKPAVGPDGERIEDTFTLAVHR